MPLGLNGNNTGFLPNLSSRATKSSTTSAS
ncbi:Uncharacterised protein [Vibrio cholerae]|nr:Uncharacterised protein [Vibrio cholerae]